MNLETQKSYPKKEKKNNSDCESCLDLHVRQQIIVQKIFRQQSAQESHCALGSGGSGGGGDGAGISLIQPRKDEKHTGVTNKSGIMLMIFMKKVSVAMLFVQNILLTSAFIEDASRKLESLLSMVLQNLAKLHQSQKKMIQCS